MSQSIPYYVEPFVISPETKKELEWLSRLTGERVPSEKFVDVMHVIIQTLHEQTGRQFPDATILAMAEMIALQLDYNFCICRASKPEEKNDRTEASKKG